MDDISLTALDPNAYLRLDPKIENLVKAIALLGNRSESYDVPAMQLVPKRGIITVKQHTKQRLQPTQSCEGHMNGNHILPYGRAFVEFWSTKNARKELWRIVGEFNQTSITKWYITRRKDDDTVYGTKRHSIYALHNAPLAKSRAELCQVQKSAERLAVLIFNKWRDQAIMDQDVAVLVRNTEIHSKKMKL